MRKICFGFILAAALSACGALQPVDEVATMQVDNAAFLTEAVQLDQMGNTEQNQLEGTLAVNQTQIAVVNALNQQLLGTLSRMVTPTPPLLGQSEPDAMGLYPQVGSTGAPVSGGTSSTGGATPYVITGISTAVNEDNGCVINPQNAFSGEVPRVYATFVAYALKQGTLLEASWYRDADQVARSSWTVDDDYEELCIWFYIQQPQDVAFTPGSWSVRLFADGQQIGNTIAFTFEALPADAMNSGGDESGNGSGG